MNPLTKMALGLIGQLRPEPPTGDGSPVLALPPPRQGGGLPLMQALARRQRTRDDRELAAATLQILLRDRTIRPRLVVGEPLRGRPDAAALASAMTALIGQAAGS